MPDKPTAVPAAEDDLLMSVDELRHYVTEVEIAKAKQSLSAYNKAHDKQRELLKQFEAEEAGKRSWFSKK